jgi:hypothetical protein
MFFKSRLGVACVLTKGVLVDNPVIAGIVEEGRSNPGLSKHVNQSRLGTDRWVQLNKPLKKTKSAEKVTNLEQISEMNTDRWKELRNSGKGRECNSQNKPTAKVNTTNLVTTIFKARIGEDGAKDSGHERKKRDKTRHGGCGGQGETGLDRT